MEDILFSIVIPTYNRSGFVVRTLESLLSQTYRNFEVIVVDDGSTDNTGEVLKGITDKRVKYFKKENGERGAARNYGARIAKGDYINFFDSDDLAYDNHIAEAYRFIKENDNPVFFHLGYDFKSPDGTLLNKVDDLKGDLSAKLVRNNFLSCNGVFLKRSLAIQFPFEEDRTLAVAEDWALWLRISSRFPILFSNMITSTVVCHDQRSIWENNVDKVIKRDRLLVETLLKDDEFRRFYKKYIKVFKSDRYTFIALTFAMQKRKGDCIKYLVKSFVVNPMVVFQKRFLASIKNLILA